MKRQRICSIGITAIAIGLLLLPGISAAEQINWADPVILDFDFQNKNKWHAEAPIQTPGDSFNTIAFMFNTDEKPPSSMAQIKIKGAFQKECVNITENFNITGTWNIIYLGEEIPLNRSENYTIEVTIKESKRSLQPESTMFGTRAGFESLPDMTLFKIGTSKTPESEASTAPLFDTGAATNDDTSDNTQGPNTNTWNPIKYPALAFTAFLLVLLAISRIKVLGIHPVAWGVLGGIFGITSLGVLW